MQDSPAKKVLVIGIDGCRPDAMVKAATPHLDRLISEGCYAVGKADPLTVSGPCWSSILCGVWAGKHGVRDNDFGGANYGEYPDFLTLLERYRPSLETVAVTSWRPVVERIVAKADYEGPKLGDGDEVTAIETASLIEDGDPDIVFVHLDAPDYAGHAYGYGPDVPEYIKAIESSDRRVGVLMNAVRARRSFVREDWLVVVTSDHGGTGKGHGLPIPEHIDVPFIVSGPSASWQMTVVPTQCDVPPTVFAFLGIEPGPEVDWDGVPVGLKGVDSKALAEQRDARTVGFDPPGGFAIGKMTVRLRTSESSSVVRITTDGKLPTATSLSASEIEVTSDLLVRARAFKKGRPIGPSRAALFQVQSDYLSGASLSSPSAGLLYRVVEGAFKSVNEPKFGSSVRQGVAARPTERLGGIKEHYAIEFSGFVRVDEDEVYQFGLYCDDGARLVIGGRTVVEHDGLHGASMKTGLVALRAGWHEMRIVYFQDRGEAVLSLAFGKEGAAMEEAPASRFAHQRTGS